MAGSSNVALVGLASGFDTGSVVEKLLAGDRARVARTQWRQQAIQTQQSQLKTVANKLTALLGAVKALSSDTAYSRGQTVASGDPSRIAATRISGAGTGGRTLQVDRLASAAQRSYDWAPAGGLDSAATLAFTPSADAAATVTMTFAAGAKLADIVAQVNASERAPVYAAAVDGRLVLSARTSGSTSDFTVGGSLLAPGGAQEDTAAARVGDRLNALVRLDGEDTPRSFQTNTLDNAIPGLRLTLKAVTSTPVSITVTPPSLDETALASQVKAIAAAFNTLVDSVRGATSEKAIPDPHSAAQASKGTLFGDTSLASMIASVRQLLLQSAAATPGEPALATIGIGAPKAGISLDDAKSGHLTVDDGALTKALRADPAEISNLFKAITAKLEPFVKSQTGGSGSIIDARVTSGDRQSRDVSDQIARANQRIENQSKHLSGRFAGMEKSLATLQTQQAWLTSSTPRRS